MQATTESCKALGAPSPPWPRGVVSPISSHLKDTTSKVLTIPPEQLSDGANLVTPLPGLFTPSLTAPVTDATHSHFERVIWRGWSLLILPVLFLAFWLCRCLDRPLFGSKLSRRSLIAGNEDGFGDLLGRLRRQRAAQRRSTFIGFGPTSGGPRFQGL